MAVTQPSSRAGIAFLQRCRNAAVLFSLLLSNPISLGKEGTKNGLEKHVVSPAKNSTTTDMISAMSKKQDWSPWEGVGVKNSWTAVVQQERFPLADGFSHTRAGTFNGGSLNQLHLVTELEHGSRKGKFRLGRVEEWLWNSVGHVTSCFGCLSS